MTKFTKFLLGGVGVFVGVPLLVSTCTLMTMSPEKRESIRQEAAAEQAQKQSAATSRQAAANSDREKRQLVVRLCNWSQEAVKDQLRSPATADFPDCVFGANEYQIRGSPDGKLFWVIGHVDSQNGFGALVRSKFVVKFEHPSPESPYQIVQVAIE